MSIKHMLTVLTILCCLVLLIIILSSFAIHDQVQLNLQNPASNMLNSFFSNNGDLQKLLDLKEFTYIINTHCKYSFQNHKTIKTFDHRFKFVWLITSFAGDNTKRNALRAAYNAKQLTQLGIRRIFLLGSLNKSAQKKTGITQAIIKKEADKFQDIIQGNFMEAYKNLTYKHLMGLQWAVDKCSNTYSYIMKMDDDIVINLYEAMELLKNKSSINDSKDFLMGYVLDHMTPIRDKESKWYVSEDEYSSETYPYFLSGWLYWINMETAHKILHQSRLHSKYFWIDDLFITGILRNKADIHNIINVNKLFTTDYRYLICCLKNDDSSTKYKCDYLVGPDGGEPYLLMTFQKYSEDCYYRYNCKTRPIEQSLNNKCILDAGNTNLDIGSAHIEEIPIDAI
ncbi:hypothetical protein TKK_0001728 [Trichogramma kaykai]